MPEIHLVPWPTETPGDRLEAWRANVGAPVALDLAPAASPRDPRRLTILSWNLYIGHGRIEEVVRRLREASDDPLVVLAQEAYRSDDSVPNRAGSRAGRRAAGRYRPRRRSRHDIVEAAQALSLNLRYIPSMRNGTGRSDRGNAILTDLPLGYTWAFELPLVLQRRVPLAATVLLPGGPLHLVSAHLDPRGPPGAKWLGAAGRARQTEHLISQLGGDLVLLGADLNLGRGRRERTWHLLQHAEFVHQVPEAPPRWRHTYHSMPRLVLDYVLVRDRTSRVASAHVTRLDEHEADRGATVFGSDHHPLLARVGFHPHRPEGT